MYWHKYNRVKDLHHDHEERIYTGSLNLTTKSKNYMLGQKLHQNWISIRSNRLTSDVTGCSRWNNVVCFRKTCRWYAVIDLRCPRKFDQSYVVVSPSAVIWWMFDDPWGADILFHSLVSVPVMISQSKDIIWGVPATRNLMMRATAKGKKNQDFNFINTKNRKISGKYPSYRKMLQKITEYRRCHAL